MQIGLSKKSKEIKASPQQAFQKQKLRALISAWHARGPKPLEWKRFLTEHGHEPNEPDWVCKLDPSRLKSFLQQATAEQREEASAEISAAVIGELETFARGLQTDPVTARFAFTVEATRLEALYNLVSDESLSEWTEEALISFDQQIDSRKQAVKRRLEWRPEGSQNRVDSETHSRRYVPGQPNWLTGRLADAPAMLGQKLTPQKAEQMVIELETLFYHYKSDGNLPRSQQPEVTLRNTYFAQGREPRVQFGQLKDAPGVEGYLKAPPSSGPRVLEFPRLDGTFVYLMFDGHHRAAAQMLSGQKAFENAVVMHLDDAEAKFGYTEQDILEAIRDLHTHLYMTEAPVPR